MPYSVIPAPPGLKFLRVWPSDRADPDRWDTDEQPVLALVIEPDHVVDPRSTGRPPEVVTPTGDTFSNAETYGFRAALVLDDGGVADAEGGLHDSVHSFVEQCRRWAAYAAARAAKASANTAPAALRASATAKA